ncbi:MAG: MFS transporter [Gammaproteobacteria bacterium]|nr:MAG: MFS transporter [Gammaproteobacteria bacterium]UTW42758.1 MFS transporter [bacterium SCSIO 12844]
MSHKLSYRSVTAVLFCHFIAASSTLGIAPFFSVILTDGFDMKPSLLVGLLYVLPTLLTALISPFWGKLADKINKKSAILRAQIGLSLSFLLASLSHDHLILFIISLSLQGLLGGTLAAANAYLAKTNRGNQLSKLLNLTQVSARASFLIAPIIIGLLIHYFSVFSIYLLLSIATFISAIWVLIAIENDTNLSIKTIDHHKQSNDIELKTNVIKTLPYTFLLIANLILSFGLVASFPYFILLTQQHFHIQFSLISGLLFGLPHAVFLVIIFMLQHKISNYSNQVTIFILSLLLLALSITFQAFISSSGLFFILRLLMGVFMTISYISLNKMIASIKLTQKEGYIFGWLDSFNKYGGVLAGIFAGICFSLFGISGPFLLSSLVLFIFAIFLIIYQFNDLSISNQRKAI